MKRKNKAWVSRRQKRRWRRRWDRAFGLAQAARIRWEKRRVVYGMRAPATTLEEAISGELEGMALDAELDTIRITLWSGR